MLDFHHRCVIGEICGLKFRITIRPQNILVKENNIVKVIDFDFGKKAIYQEDFYKKYYFK